MDRTTSKSPPPSRERGQYHLYLEAILELVAFMWRNLYQRGQWSWSRSTMRNTPVVEVPQQSSLEGDRESFLHTLRRDGYEELADDLELEWDDKFESAD